LKLIYRAKDITEAQILSGLLASNGIKSHVGGFYLQGGIGDLSAMDFATLYVADENVESAMAIITEYDATIASTERPQHRSSFTIPIIILLLSIFMIIILAIAFGADYH
jgi:hypothetical protein